MDEVQGRLAKCFSAVLPGLSPEEILRADPTSVTSWDSVTTVTLVSVVEQEFGVAIDLEELEGFVSFDQLLQLIRHERSVKTRPWS